MFCVDNEVDVFLRSPTKACFVSDEAVCVYVMV